jgi:hypothetical protein
MEQWMGYFAISRFTANLNDDNWVTLVDEVRNIVSVIEANQPYERVFGRGNMDTFNYGTEEEPNWYSNAYIFIGHFPAGAVDFDKFKERLIDLFGDPPGETTYTTNTVILRDRPSVFATYKYNAINRIRVSLFGCASDTELCTRHESNNELLQFLADNAAEWGENIT